MSASRLGFALLVAAGAASVVAALVLLWLMLTRPLLLVRLAAGF